jgi:hypothetical protein
LNKDSLDFFVIGDTGGLYISFDVINLFSGIGLDIGRNFINVAGGTEAQYCTVEAMKKVAKNAKLDFIVNVGGKFVFKF